MMFQFLQNMYNTFIDRKYYNLDKKIRIKSIETLNNIIANDDDKYIQTTNDDNSYDISYDNSQNDFDENNMNIQETFNSS